MVRYKVRLSKLARCDVVDIVNYLYGLAGEISARRYSALFDNAFKKLENTGSGMAVIGKTGKCKREIRRIRVKRYVVYYTVDEVKKEILVVRIAHGSRDKNRLF